MMNIDDAIGIVVDEVLRNDLHVSGEYNKGNFFFVLKFALFLFDQWHVAVVFVDVPDVIGDRELFGHVAEIFVVAENAGDLDVPFSGFISRQQIIEAVAHFADENGHSLGFVAKIEVERHLVTDGVKRGEDILNFVAWN